ncbi:MAG TPA: S53 family peptidase [Candidatus Saccharimonadales bacterium]|nr:S53 family peptidase [Candidatus Saccharimonadales bacterium]
MHLKTVAGVNRWRSLFAGAAAFTLLASMSIPVVAEMRPLHIRSEKAEPLVAAGGTVATHFGCETRPFNLSKGLFCYGPAAIRKAYGVFDLINGGITGKGQTIVIIDAYGSPTLAADLAAFDSVFGLPDPPSITEFHMPGSTPFDNTDPNQLGWAEESSLDVQWAHAIAPGADIILVAAVTNGDQDILDAQNYAIDHKLGKIMSESFGELEFLETPALLAANEQSYQRARDANISVFASAGDDGATGADQNGDLVPFATPQYPASSPHVTAVGGTNLFFGTTTNADPNGTYQGEVVWNDGFGAGGGGVSKIFSTPNYQTNHLSRAALAELGGFRGYPDISYNAGVVGGVIVHLGFFANTAQNGYYIFGGTSAGAPQLSGVTSLANQLNHGSAGFINNGLYAHGANGLLNRVMHDITVGNNDFLGVTGFAATPSWDLASGWGTPARGYAATE